MAQRKATLLGLNEDEGGEEPPAAGPGEGEDDKMGVNEESKKIGASPGLAPCGGDGGESNSGPAIQDRSRSSRKPGK
jgi:hypothetical protein